jgi:RimJ/RimL family protein N-acetyltransferase
VARRSPRHPSSRAAKLARRTSSSSSADGCGRFSRRISAFVAAHERPATAEVGVTFAPREGRSPAMEALAAVVTALFEDHGIHRVFAESDDRNATAHALLERLGVRQEALLVEADWVKDDPARPGRPRPGVAGDYAPAMRASTACWSPSKIAISTISSPTTR